MDLTTLQKANDLNEKIEQCTKVLKCFEWQPYCDEERMHERVSTNPTLIIEYDGADDRQEQRVPFELNPEIIAAIKWWTTQKRDQVVKQFNNL